MGDRAEEKRLKKGFFAKLFDKLDKKMEEKAKASPCGCQNGERGEKKSCCS